MSLGLQQLHLFNSLMLKFNHSAYILHFSFKLFANWLLITAKLQAITKP